MTNFCSVCGASNDSTALYCVRCGASLAQNVSATTDWSNPFAPPPETTAFGGGDGEANDPNAPEIPGFVGALKICLLKKYADFSGRASRSEFWYFQLSSFLLIGVVGALVGGVVVATNAGKNAAELSALINRTSFRSECGSFSLFRRSPSVVDDCTIADGRVGA